MAAGVTMRQMLEAGVHFGHQTRRWNPRMRPFIFTERHGIHILDLAQTVHRLDAALQKVREVVSGGQTVLFVGTKKQAQETIRTQADRCSMPYVTNRWLGGTLTNWTTISRRIEHLRTLESRVLSVETASLRKKERLKLEKEFARMERHFGGIRNLDRLPGLIYIIDPHMEEIPVREANRAKIPIVAMCDTDADPEIIDFPVPSNDDAIRAIQLITTRIADAVLEGTAYGEVEREAAAVAATPPPAASSAADAAPAPEPAPSEPPSSEAALSEAAAAAQPAPAAGQAPAE